jgi:uncharacterized membrane protein
MEEITLQNALKEVEHLRKQIRNANVTHKESLTALDGIAVKVTDYVGSVGSFLIIFGWTAIWLGWNTLAPKEVRFDPFPAFVLWLFISNMVQIFLMPLIMIGQNLQGRHAEIRAESDFKVNVKAEKEIEVILLHLVHQNELMMQILKHLKKNKGK